MANLTNLFKLNNQPISLSPSQQQIFDLILYKQAIRAQIIAPTQYGKCVKRGSLVAMADGSQLPIEDVKIGDTVLSMDDDYRIRPQRVLDVVNNNTKPTVSVKLRSGRQVSLTSDHPVFADRGWTPVRDLRPGDFIATPRTLPISADDDYDKNRMKVLGYLLGDGSISIRNNIGFTTASQAIADDLSTALPSGLVLKKLTSKHGYRISMTHPVKNGHTINSWLKDIGLSGTNSHTKFIPGFVFTLRNELVATMLNRMYACDGWASVNRSGVCEIGYCSVSREMIDQLQMLLLRFGIGSRIDTKRVRYNGGYNTAYQLIITGRESQLRFAKYIGIFSKEEQVERVRSRQLLRGCREQHDIIPRKQLQGLNLYAADWKYGFTFNSRSSNIGRVNTQRLAVFYTDLNTLAHSDIYWDRIESINPDGSDVVYDLCIENSHNFIANGIIVHNSLTVALATLLRAVSTDERFIILAPSEKKAQIIMGYIISHAFDSPMITDQLELDASVSLDRLRRERSRNHITFKGGGGIKTLTLDAKNGKKSVEAAMGFGGNRLILDESSLIDDVLYATVKRMLGGYAYHDTFLLEIGNPFYRNHFHRTWHDDLYHKVFIDYHTGLKEGRYSPEFIEEMRKEALFDIFYECKFPDEDTIDDKGYRPIITSDIVQASYTDTFIDEGELKLGVDVAGGGDENVYVLRSPATAMIVGRNRSDDTMTNVVEVERLLNEHPRLKPENVFIDDIGIGRGVTDRLKEKGVKINGVSVGLPAQDTTKYANIKAENYWNTANWLRQGGKLVRGDGWMQLPLIKYKVSSDKVMQIEPKLDLKRRSGRSPDVAEALMLSHGTPVPEPLVGFYVLD